MFLYGIGGKQPDGASVTLSMSLIWHLFGNQIKQTRHMRFE